MKYYVETPIELYSYEELNESAKARVKTDKVQQMSEIIPYENASRNMKKAIDKAEEMMTPWFTYSYIFDYCHDEIVENIKEDKALYDSNGVPIAFPNEKGDYFLHGALLTKAEQDDEFVPVYNIDKIINFARGKNLFTKTSNTYNPSLLNRFAEHHTAAQLRAEIEKGLAEGTKYYMKCVFMVRLSPEK